MHKKIIIKTGIVKNISFEELAKLNEYVIWKNYNKWKTKFEYEDLKQICLMAMWQAYLNYDISKGKCFGTVADVYMFYTLSKEYRANKRHNVKGISLEEEFKEGLFAKDTVASHINYIDEFETNEYINKLLSDRERTVLKLLSENYTQKQIAKALNTVQCSISRVLERVRKKFIEEGYKIA
jgi:RNA polymerase sigma factor (sigma-70 family)